MLGLQLALGDILALGPGMIIVVLLIVGFGIGGTLFIGRALVVPPMQRLLIACGFSICGAAAVAAVDGAVDAEEDVASAIGLVVVFGTAMVGVAPALLGLMGLTHRRRVYPRGGAGGRGGRHHRRGSTCPRRDCQAGPGADSLPRSSW